MSPPPCTAIATMVAPTPASNCAIVTTIGGADQTRDEDLGASDPRDQEADVTRAQIGRGLIARGQHRKQRRQHRGDHEIRGERRRPLLEQARDVAVEQPRHQKAGLRRAELRRPAPRQLREAPSPRTGRRTPGTAGRARSTACSAGRAGSGLRCGDARARPIRCVRCSWQLDGAPAATGAPRPGLVRHRDRPRAEQREDRGDQAGRRFPKPNPTKTTSDHSRPPATSAAATMTNFAALRRNRQTAPAIDGPHGHQQKHARSPRSSVGRGCRAAGSHP